MKKDASPIVIKRTQIFNLICQCLEALNQERAAEDQIEISKDTLLLADDSSLDSLAFVVFSTDLEERLAALTGNDLTLVATAISSGQNYFRSVDTLTDYIETLLQKPKGCQSP